MPFFGLGIDLMAVWWMTRMVDLPWQSTNKRSLETVMFRNITGLLEMAVCCAKPPYAVVASKALQAVSNTAYGLPDYLR
jgi:hypothetical protein